MKVNIYIIYILYKILNKMITINNCCQYHLYIYNKYIIGIYCNYYLYSFLFFTLFITSVIYHSNYTDFTYILDKTLCFYIVLYGTLLFYQKGREHFNLRIIIIL